MNSNEKWDVRVERAVTKALRKFPQKDSDAIEVAIVGMSDDLYFGDIQRIGGEKNTWRRHVGSYRISYEVYPNLKLVIVFKVVRRTSTTY